MGLLSEFNVRQAKIRSWLDSVRSKWQSRDDVLFELTFCLCTPQSRAPVCRTVIRKLKEKGLLGSADDRNDILSHLDGVRFPNNKASYIIEAHGKFDSVYKKIQTLSVEPFALRDWLVVNIKGYGYKEASHFLRNIGLGEDMAILDVHILREMADAGLIDGDVKSLTPKRYLENEKKFVELARKFGLKPAELDIAIWLARSGNEEIM